MHLSEVFVWGVRLRVVVVVMDDAELNILRGKYPLPEEVEDAVLNRSQLALALGVSDNTVTKYLGKGLPCVSQGGNGRDYEFQLSDCYAWRRSQDEEATAKKLAGDRIAAQMALHFRGEDPDLEPDEPILSAKEIRAEADADYHRNRAAELRRELTRVSAVREMVETMIVDFRTQITALVDFAEMEFGLSPGEVDKFQRRCDGALMQARQEMANGIGVSEPIPLRETQERFF